MIYQVGRDYKQIMHLVGFMVQYIFHIFVYMQLDHLECTLNLPFNNSIAFPWAFRKY